MSWTCTKCKRKDDAPSRSQIAMGTCRLCRQDSYAACPECCNFTIAPGEEKLATNCAVCKLYKETSAIATDKSADQPCRQCGRSNTPGAAKCWWCECPSPC